MKQTSGLAIKRTNNKGRCLQSEHYGRVSYGLVQQR